MIIPDLNLLIYAYNSSSRFHQRAAPWWSSCLSGDDSVGLDWVVVLGFLRLATNLHIFGAPMTADEAVSHIQSWLERPNVKIVSPGPRHAELLFGFLRTAGQAGNLTTDAHLAALAVESRAVIHTADTDFQRFSGVRWLNPLQ